MPLGMPRSTTMLRPQLRRAHLDFQKIRSCWLWLLLSAIDCTAAPWGALKDRSGALKREDPAAVSQLA